MVLFLRDNRNESLLDLEIVKARNNENKLYSYVELHSNVCVEPYSRFLLDNLDKSERIIEVFEELSDLRSWLWEYYFPSVVNEENTAKYYDDVLKRLRELIKGVAKEFDLAYVED